MKLADYIIDLNANLQQNKKIEIFVFAVSVCVANENKYESQNCFSNKMNNR